MLIIRITRIFESGILFFSQRVVDFSQAEWSTRIEQCLSWNTPLKPPIPDFEKVDLMNTQECFKYFGVGLLIATLVLIFEYSIHWKGSKRQMNDGGANQLDQQFWSNYKRGSRISAATPLFQARSRCVAASRNRKIFAPR